MDEYDFAGLETRTDQKVRRWIETARAVYWAIGVCVVAIVISTTWVIKIDNKMDRLSERLEDGKKERDANRKCIKQIWRDFYGHELPVD